MEEHEPYGGRYGWEGLSPDNMIVGEVSVYKDPPLHRQAKERSMHFQFVIEIDTKNAGTWSRTRRTNAVATMLFK